MTKPLVIEIEDSAAANLARIANDLGETPEQFAARAIHARMETFSTNPFFARRGKDFDKEATLAWLDQLATRQGPSPDADDAIPEGYQRAR